jgi:hypothetical protein
MNKIVAIYYPIAVEDLDQSKCSRECPQLRRAGHLLERNCALFSCRIYGNYERPASCQASAVGQKELDAAQQQALEAQQKDVEMKKSLDVTPQD